MHNLIPIMKRMTGHIKQLNYALTQADIIQAHVFSIPQYSKTDEAQLLDKGLKTCLVNRHSDNDAIEVAKDAYLDMYVYDTELSTRFTRKHLGIITVKNDHERIRETVELINIAKAEFKAEVQTIGDEEAKFEAVHKALPGLVTSTAYRSIHIKDNVKAVYFNWAKRARSEKVDTEKLIQQIKDGTGKGAYLSPAQRLRELILLNDHKHRTLRFKRPINVRPECSIRDNQDTLKGTTVGLPIIILADEPVRFTPLGNYDPKTTKASQRSQWKLIIPRLNLYSL